MSGKCRREKGDCSGNLYAEEMSLDTMTVMQRAVDMVRHRDESYGARIAC